MNIIVGSLVALAALFFSVVAVKFLATWAIITLFVIFACVGLYFTFRNQAVIVAATMPFLWYAIVPIVLVFGAYLLYALNFPELRQATARLSYNLMMDGVFGLQKQSLETENEQGTFGTLKDDVIACDKEGAPIHVKVNGQDSILTAKRGAQVFARDLEPHYVKKGSEGMARVMLMDANSNFADGPEAYVPLRQVDWKNGKKENHFTVSPTYVTPVQATQAPATITPAEEAAPADYDVNVIIKKRSKAKAVSMNGRWRVTPGDSILIGTMSGDSSNFTFVAKFSDGGETVFTGQCEEMMCHGQWTYNGSLGARGGKFEEVTFDSRFSSGTGTSFDSVGTPANLQMRKIG